MGVQFKSGGTFKLCFCDASLTKDGVCMTEKDYKIEVGTIHASGVSCLIADPKLQRVSCTPQAHGGLRCYEHMDAPMPVAPQIGIAEFVGRDDAAARHLHALHVHARGGGTHGPPVPDERRVPVHGPPPQESLSAATPFALHRSAST